MNIPLSILAALAIGTIVLGACLLLNREHASNRCITHDDDLTWRAVFSLTFGTVALLLSNI